MDALPDTRTVTTTTQLDVRRNSCQTFRTVVPAVPPVMIRIHVVWIHASPAHVSTFRQRIIRPKEGDVAQECSGITATAVVTATVKRVNTATRVIAVRPVVAL